MYTKIQRYHGSFFASTERAFLINFVILALHPFDRDNRSYSMYKVDDEKTKKFVEDNDRVIQALFDLRNQVFAHRDLRVTKDTISGYKIPSVDDLDLFFKNLLDYYNQLTREVDQSITYLDNAEGLKREIELLFMNLERGETVRLKEIEIKWDWFENDKKASDIL